MGPSQFWRLTSPSQPALGTRQNSKNDPTDLPPGVVPYSGECGWTLSTRGDTALVSTSHFMAKLRFITLPSPLKTANVFSSWRQRPGEEACRGLQKPSVAPWLTASSKRGLNPITTTNCVLPTTWKFEKRSCPGPVEEFHAADIVRSVLSTEHRRACTDFTYRVVSNEMNFSKLPNLL